MTGEDAESYRAEVVGSMLRLVYLLQAREKHAAGLALVGSLMIGAVSISR